MKKASSGIIISHVAVLILGFYLGMEYVWAGCPFPKLKQKVEEKQSVKISKKTHKHLYDEMGNLQQQMYFTAEQLETIEPTVQIVLGHQDTLSTALAKLEQQIKNPTNRENVRRCAPNIRKAMESIQKTR